MIIIDRFEKDIAVCETDNGMTEIKRDMLPHEICEGDVIVFNGTVYEKDEAATLKRIERIKKLTKK